MPQFEQRAAFVVVEYVLPLMQAVHPMFEAAAHAKDTYWPAEHVLQLEQVAAFVVVEYVLPPVHEPHTMFEVTVHADNTYWPAGQVPHVEQTEAPVVVEYVLPAVQAVQVPALLYVPGLHRLTQPAELVAPADEVVPPGQE